MRNRADVRRTRRAPPQSLPGFEGITRYWDQEHDRFAAKILPGEYYVTRDPDEMVVTVLGSCISACIRDPELGIGGMNHFMLPVKKDESEARVHGNAERYGSFAMESLINQVLNRGGQRQYLEVKVTGGGKVLAITSDVGRKNIAFVREFLREEGFEILAEDLGDVYPRKVYYQPGTGRLRVKKLREVTNDTISVRETAYAQRLAKEPQQAEVDLF